MRIAFDIEDQAAQRLDEAAALHRTSRADMCREAVTAWVEPTGDPEELYSLTSGLSDLELHKLVGYLCGISERVPPVAGAMRKAVESVRRGV